MQGGSPCQQKHCLANTNPAASRGAGWRVSATPSCQRGRFPAGEITRGFAPLAPKPHLPREQRPCWLHLYQQRMCTRWMWDLNTGPGAQAACGGESCCVGGRQHRSCHCGGASGAAGVLSGVHCSLAWRGGGDQGKKGARCPAGGTSVLTRGLVKAREATGRVLP